MSQPEQPILNWTRPKLYKAQAAFVDCDARITCVFAATKAGKTVALIVWLWEQALKGKEGQHFWWVAPTYRQAAIAFSRMRRFIRGSAFPQELYQIREGDQIIEVAGRIIEFKGADNVDSLYGEDVYACVIDEASRCPAQTWPAIRSTLTKTRGPVKIIGNVIGRKNWAYRLAMRAQAGAPGMAFFKLTAWDAVEGGLLRASDVEAAKSDLADDPDAFKQLYLAEPADDGGNPFGLDAIERCISPLSTDRPVVFGADLAKSTDWTVLIGLDRDGHVCFFERWRGDWRQTKERILNAVGNTATLVDATGVGDPIVEDLQRFRLNITGHKSSGAVIRQELLQGLRASIQQGSIRFPKGQIVNELEAFEFIYTTNAVKYQVSSGSDDCVFALALANKHYMDNTFHRIAWGSGGVLMASMN